MATRFTKADLQRAIHGYRQAHNVHIVDMRKVAEWARRKLGMEPPTPKDPIDELAAKLAKAAREETRTDPATGRSYRVNHAYPVAQGQKQLTLWVDIDHATRKQMHISLQKRRDQMVGDAYQLTLDADYWNSSHATEQPIEMVMDFTDDVAERKALDGADDGEEAA